MSWLPGISHALNLHPMFVHFPIVLMFLAFLFQTLALWREETFFNHAARLTFQLLAVVAVITVYTGFRAADSLGHESPGHDFVHYHRDLMVIFTVVAVVLALLFQFVRQLDRPIIRWIAFLILTGWLVYSADKGAELVFRYGMGVHIETNVHTDEHQHAPHEALDQDEHNTGPLEHEAHDDD